MSDLKPNRKLNATAKWLVIAVGSICVFLGATSLLYWSAFDAKQVGLLFPMRVFPSFAILFAGIGFLLTIFRLKSLTTVCAVIVSAIGLFDAIQVLWDFPLPTGQWTGFSQNPHALHGSVVSSLAIFNSGVCFLVGTGKNRVRRVFSGAFAIGPLSIGFAGLFILAYESLSADRFPATEHEFLTSFSFLIIGIMLLYWSGRGRYYRSHLDFVPALTLFVCGILTIGFVHTAKKSEFFQLNSETARGANSLSAGISDRFQAHIEAQERMASRWGGFDSVSHEAWRSDALRYVNDYKYFSSIVWIDPNWMIKWVASSEDSGKKLVGLDLEKLGNSKLLKKLRAENGTQITDTVSLYDDGKSLISVTPIGTLDNRLGYVAGVYDLDPMLSSMISESVWKDFDVAVYGANEMVFSNQTGNRQAHTILEARKTVSLSDKSYILHMRPDGARIADLARKNNLMFLFGVLISCFFSVSVLFAISAKKKKLKLAEINRELKRTLEERSVVEEQLRVSSEFRNAIFDGADSAIFSTDSKGNLTSANDRGLELLGLEDGKEVNNTNIAQHLHPDEFEITDEFALGHGLRDEEKFKILLTRENQAEADNNWTVIRTDGSKIPALVSVTPMIDGESDVDGYLIVARDNSRQVAIDHELDELQTRFHAFLNNAPFLAYLKDDRGRYVYSNERFESTFGMEAGELIGKTVFDLVPAKRAQEIQEYEEEVRRTREPQSRIDILDGNDRAYGHFLFSRFPIELPDGRVFIGVVAIEVTSQVEIEEELREANRVAIESSKLKSEFLANMSHEIRTPMNGILGMTEVLLETELTKSQREFGEVVQDSANSLLRIINDILDFSKVESGQMSVERVRYDLNTLFENTLALFGDGVYAKGVEIVMIKDPDVETNVWGDPGRVRQVLTNLVSNAVKFTNKGTVVIAIERVSAKKGEQVLRISVKDSGIGIDEKSREKLFAPFVQADGSLERRFGGTGLGLSISRRLVELMGGDIGFESKLGEGSEFWFTLSCETVATESENQNGYNFESLKVLVIDDLEVSRTAASNQLEMYGISPYTSASARDAISLCTTHAKRDEPFDVVLIDTSLPEINGYDLAEILNSNPQTGGAKTVLLPPPSERDKANEAIEQGVFAFMTKPIKQVELLNLLSMIVHKNNRIDLQENGPEGVVLKDRFEDAEETEERLVLIAVSERKAQIKIGMMLELLGFDSDVVTRGDQILDSVRDKNYLCMIVDLDLDLLQPEDLKDQIIESTSKSIPVLAFEAGGNELSEPEIDYIGWDGIFSLSLRPDEIDEILRVPEKLPRHTDKSKAANEEENYDRVEKHLNSISDDIGTDILEMTIELFFDESQRQIDAVINASTSDEIKEHFSMLEKSYSDIGATLYASEVLDNADENQLRGLTDKIIKKHEKLLDWLTDFKECIKASA